MNIARAEKIEGIALTTGKPIDHADISHSEWPYIETNKAKAEKIEGIDLPKEISYFEYEELADASIRVYFELKDMSRIVSYIQLDFTTGKASDYVDIRYEQLRADARHFSEHYIDNINAVLTVLDEMKTIINED